MQTEDSTGNTFQEALTVDITNEAPNITNPTQTAVFTGTDDVSESASNGTVVGTVINGGDTSSVRYSITGGTGRDAFAINQTTGEITVSDSCAFDFETATDNELTLNVEATDRTNPTSQATISIGIEDAPPILTDEQEFTVSEDASNGTIVGTVVSTGDQSGAIYGISGFQNTDAFSIDPNTGEIVVNNSSALDFDTKSDYDLAVEIKDDASDSTADDTTTVTINLTDVNQAPSFSSSSQTFIVDESSFDFGPVSATDDDGDTLTYSISGGVDQDLFEINSDTGAISFKSAPNHENPADSNANNIYLLQVSAEDESGLSASQNLSVRVNDSAATLKADATVFSVSESASNGTAVGVAAADTGDRSATYTITDSNGQASTVFDIDSTGEITVIDSSAIDFETNGTNSFTVNVTADDDSSSNNATYAINVTENATPTFGNKNLTPQVEENTATVTALDITNDEGESLNYTFDGADGDLFTVDSEGELQFINAPDFENPLDADGDNVYEVEVTATDSGDLSASESFSVTVTNANEAPTVSNRINVQENITTVATLETSDSDGDAIFTYSIAGGADSGMFDISDGDLSFAEAPDFETPMDADGNNIYEVQVMATSEEDTAMQTFRVNVSDVDETVQPPTIGGTGISGSSSTSSADFDGDGDFDALLIGGDGKVSVLLMDGTSVEEQTEILTLRDTSWQMQGTGDFNGDGNTDLFWRNTSSGLNTMWLMDGAELQGSRLPAVTKQAWEVTNIADFSGDGQADLVWNNTSTGAVALWEMNDDMTINGSLIVPATDIA